MDLELTGQHVLITGGSKGIGLACAEGFLQEGAKLTLVSREASNLDKAKQMLQGRIAGSANRIHTCVADLRQASQAQSALDCAIQAFGPVDVLVNSAGAAQRTPPDELNANAWHAAMDAKYFSYIHMIDLVVKQMGQRGRGNIVNVVGAGGKVANPIHLPGGAANAALMFISAGLAAAYAPKGVRVNAVNPGATETDRLISGLEAAAKLQQVPVDIARQRAIQGIPLGRMGQPVDVANAVLFLASSKASYISGAIVSMDGAVNPIVV